LEECLYIGNMDVRRDWGYAPDYVRAMWLMLQQEQADDYVVATGESHSVRELIKKAFAHAGMQVEWDGEGADEVGIDPTNGNTVVRVDPKYYRPIDIDSALGDASKAKRELGWEPEVKFDQLVKIMMDADLAATRNNGQESL
ncbi:MAG: GDP-mannose 4,6-dehydratase, partial [Verrucomicrobia bacterium]|nr:GDP-mannose 4,6-dehydratase [Verrucomicrobiota bacterium]